MDFQKFQITGKGSTTRYEYDDGRPYRGAEPDKAPVKLVRHSRTDNPVMLLEPELAERPSHSHLALKPAGLIGIAPASETPADGRKHKAKADKAIDLNAPAKMTGGLE